MGQIKSPAGTSVRCTQTRWHHLPHASQQTHVGFLSVLQHSAASQMSWCRRGIVAVSSNFPRTWCRIAVTSLLLICIMSSPSTKYVAFYRKRNISQVLQKVKQLYPKLLNTHWTSPRCVHIVLVFWLKRWIWPSWCRPKQQIPMTHQQHIQSTAAAVSLPWWCQRAISPCLQLLNFAAPQWHEFPAITCMTSNRLAGESILHELISKRTSETFTFVLCRYCSYGMCKCICKVRELRNWHICWLIN